MDFPYRSLKKAEMINNARDVFERICLMKPTEKTLIISDFTGSLNVIESLVAASKIIEAEPIVMVIDNPPYPGKYEVSESILAAIREADCTIQITSNSLAHTEASKLAMEKTETRPNGGVFASMNGATDINLMTGGIKETGTLRLKEMTEKTAAELKGKNCRVTSEAGTNVTFELSDNFFLFWGEQKPRPVYHLIPSGEVANGIIPDSVEGTIVIDGMQEGLIPLRWPYDYPIRYDLTEGKITRIYGGTAAKVFRKLIFEIGDERAKYLGEFAIGTNPEAVTTGALQEDKHVLGTVHFSPGEGPLNESMLHLDGVVLMPTVEVDGKIIVDKGEPKFH